MQTNKDKTLQTIQKSLISRDIGKDDTLLEDALKSMLDKRTKTGFFNEDLFDQLIAQIHKKHSQITIWNFSEIWLQAEEKLSNGYEKLNLENEQLQNEREILVSRIKNLKESLNAKNIMEDSTLTIKFKEISNFLDKQDNFITGKFQLRFEGQTQETQMFSKKSEIILDKIFVFQVLQAEEPLEIWLITQSQSYPETFLKIFLQDLISQNNMEIEQEHLIEVDNITGEESESQITISLDIQWIYSRKKLVQDQINQVDQQRQQKLQLLKNTWEYIEDLYSLFPELQKPEIIDQKFNTASPILITESTSVFEQNFETAPKEVNEKLSKFYLYSIYAFVILGLFGSILRNLFPDIFIGLLLFSSLQINLPRNLQSFSLKCIIGLSVIQILELIWLYNHQYSWWTNQFGNLSSFSAIRKLEIFFSHLLLINRACLIFFTAYNYKNTDQGKNEFNIQED